MCQLSGVNDRAEYARERMGWRGSGVFNANLFPLGKPSLAEWPASYSRLLGVSRSEYEAVREDLYAERAKLFRRMRRKYQPQAVVCFGKSCWSRFEEVFVTAPARWVQPDRSLDIHAYESDRVILTPHFARGSLMPNTAVDSVVTILRRWNVRLPS